MITLDVQKSRIYLRGNTFPVKDQIKALGGHWDADEKAWWIGKAKAQEAAQLANAPQSAQQTARKPDTVETDTPIWGKAAYKGKSGYLILWVGTTRKGEAAKLAFSDGSKVFWADRSEIKVEKTYQSDSEMTFGKLNQLRAEYAAAQLREDKAAIDMRKLMADRDAAREAKATATGKTMAEIIAEEDAAKVEARKGLVGFTRAGKDSVMVGETFTAKGKDYEVVSVGKSYYYSAQDEEMDEDMDNFRHESRGWHTPFDARNTTTPEQAAQRTAEAEERKALEIAIRGSYSHLDHIGSSAPDGVAMTDIWSDRRMAGSENWYCGSDGIVYHMRSDYDMGPSWWRTSATTSQIERAKALGMKVIS